MTIFAMRRGLPEENKRAAKEYSLDGPLTHLPLLFDYNTALDKINKKNNKQGYDDKACKNSDCVAPRLERISVRRKLMYLVVGKHVHAGHGFIGRKAVVHEPLADYLGLKRRPDLDQIRGSNGSLRRRTGASPLRYGGNKHGLGRAGSSGNGQQRQSKIDNERFCIKRLEQAFHRALPPAFIECPCGILITLR